MALTQISTQGIKDGTITGTDLATNVDLVDNQKLRLGNSQDLQIFHDPQYGHSFIKESGPGALIFGSDLYEFYNAAISEKMLTATENGAVELYHDNVVRLTTSTTGLTIGGGIVTTHHCTFGGHLLADTANIRDIGSSSKPFNDAFLNGITMLDNKKIALGNSADLQIFHDGSNSKIVESGTGSLIIQTSNFNLDNAGGTENILTATENGAVELYHNGSKKFETTSLGISIPTDSTFLQIGAGQDLDLHHNGTNSYIRNKTGDLHIRPLVAEEGIILKPNGAVELYHDNSKKLETTSGGIDVDGSVTADDIITAGALLHEGDTDTLVHFSAANTIQLKTGGTSKLLVNNFGLSLENGDLNTNGNRIILGDSSGANDDRIVLGNNNDLEIYHNGTASFIKNTTGGLNLEDTGGYFRVKSDDIKLEAANGEDFLECDANGAVSLYFNASKKFETTSDGVKISGAEGVEAILTFEPDEGDNASDKFRFRASDSAGFFLENGSSNDTSIKANFNGSVELYHTNSKKFETTSNGVTVSVASGDPQLIVTGPGHAQLQLTSTSGTDHCGVNFGDNDDNNAGMIQYTNSNNRMQFHTNGSERLRIESGGALTFVGASTRAGNTNSICSSNNNSIDINVSEYFYLRHGNGTEILRARSTGNVSIGTTNTTHRFTAQNTSATQITGFFLSGSTSYSSSTLISACSRNTSNGSYTHFKCAVNGVADKFRVLDSGAIQSTSNSIGGISDERLKENIVDAGSQWDDIKNIRVRKFNFKKLTDPEQKTMLGVVAQEAETICPGLVESTVQLQEGVEQEYKSFKYSILYMKAVKCLQEAMARIEVLETEVAALKAA